MDGKSMMAGVLARMKPAADDDSDDEFSTAAKEFVKAMKGGSEEEIASALRSCCDIACTENHQPDDES